MAVKPKAEAKTGLAGDRDSDKKFLSQKQLQTYPRYSTALFLSRTATDEPGSARRSVALEPSSKSILNSVLVSRTDFTLPPGGIAAGPAVLIFMRYSSSKRTKTAPGSTVAAFTVRPAITFVSFWFLGINLLACSTGRRISALPGFQLRHEFALLGFSVKP